MLESYQGRLFLRSWGNASESIGCVVIVHGLSEHSGRYEQVAERLVKAGHYVLAYDARGHGQSPGKRGHAEAYSTLLNDLEGAIAATGRPAHEVFLYGHSLGGGLVLNYALQRCPDVRGVIASSPLILPATPPPGWKVRVGKLLNRVWPTARLNPGIEPGGRSRDPQVDIDFAADPLTHRCLTARLAVEILREGRVLLTNAARLTTPCLLMHGDADPITSFAASEQFANSATEACRFRVWQDGLHELHWETNREQVLDEVLEWLERHA